MKTSERRAQDRARIRSLLIQTQTTGSWADKMNFDATTVLSDLARCTHGRLVGDVCTGCPGQVSLGNPLLPPGAIIGTSLGRNYMIRVPLDPRDHHDPRAWYVAIDAGSFEQIDYVTAVAEAERAQRQDEGLDG